MTSINDYEDGFPNHWIVYVVPSDVQILMQRNVDALKKYQLKTSKFFVLGFIENLLSTFRVLLNRY